MYGYILLLARNTNHHADSLLEILCLQQRKKLREILHLLAQDIEDIRNNTMNHSLMSKINQVQATLNFV